VNRAAVATAEISSGPTATVAAAILACESGGCGCGRDFIRTKTARLRLDVAGCLNSTVPKEDMEDYHWVMFTHAMEFFKECASLKKPIPKHFFTSLLNDLST